jgi:cardiolipin synthase
LQNIKNSGTILEENSNIEFYFTGRDALDAMYLSIQNAKKHIHLQSYIIEDDNTGKRFAKLLKEKALSSIEVRIIYDGLGSYKLSSQFIEELSGAGIEVLCFSPIKIMALTSKLNYRNHRKILVVDGTEGFLGGVNIADRYYYGNSIGDWHDTHLKVIGETVRSLQMCFLLDRYFIKNRKVKRRKKYFPTVDIPDTINQNNLKKIYSQTIISGPDSSWASIMQCYFSAITSATKHIYIVTPYFTPNESILNATTPAEQ